MLIHLHPFGTEQAMCLLGTPYTENLELPKGTVELLSNLLILRYWIYLELKY